MGISRPKNWIFLGDSISEGVGSSRISYVSELAKLLRSKKDECITEVRLRKMDVGSFSKFVNFNIAGNIEVDNSVTGNHLWIWNLASEGTTCVDDKKWFSFVENIKPERVFLLRGPYESIVRPDSVFNGKWPLWMPQSWRTPAGLDPRCYFSNTWWRAAKQICINHLKQKIRLQFLKKSSGYSILPDDQYLNEIDKTVNFLLSLEIEVWILECPPVNNSTFPGSPKKFSERNSALKSMVASRRIKFVEWDCHRLGKQQYFNDGFHLNQSGATEIALQLLANLDACV